MPFELSSQPATNWANLFTQSQRLLRADIGGEGNWNERLVISRFSGNEAMSQCYAFDVEMLSNDAHLELKHLLGRPITLTLLTDQRGAGMLGATGGRWLESDNQHRTFGGIIDQAEQQGSDGGFTRYKLHMVPALQLLDLKRSSRVFQDKSVPDIVELVLKEHQTHSHLLVWDSRLRQSYLPRSYVVQYRESDLTFIQRLLAEEGIHYHFEHGKNAGTHTLVLADDIHTLSPNASSAIRFHRTAATEAEDTITEWHARRQLQAGTISMASFDYKAVTTQHTSEPTNQHQGDAANQLAANLEHYDPQTAYYGSGQNDQQRYTQLRIEAMEAAAKTFSGSGSVRTLQPGTWFELDQHPVHDTDQQEHRQFVLLNVQHDAQNNLSDGLSDRGEPNTYTNSFTVQRRSVPYRPPFQETRLAKPKALGIQTAMVVGPANEEIYTDHLGRVKIQFHWQRPQDHNRDITGSSAAFDEMSACWVRVASSLAGQNYGELFLPRIGQEVLIDFIEGDIDRPVIVGRLYNGSQTPPTFSNAGTLPNNKTLSGIKTKTYKGTGYNELLFDDTPQEERTKLSTEHAKTQLNMGYLIHPRTGGKGQPRGEGMELRTDAWGAIRAGKGLLISTDGKANATSTHLDSKEATQQLDASLNQSKAQSDLAQQHHAEPLNANITTEHLLKVAQATHKQNGSTGAGLDVPGYSEPIITLSSPPGLVYASPMSTTLANGEDLHLTQAQDLNVATGRSLVGSIMQQFSWFVAGVDSKTKQTVISAIKLFSGKGNIEVQAQSDNIEITAAQDVKIMSVDGHITIAAKNEILLTAGGGYIRLMGGNIDVHVPGVTSVKGAKHSLTGPDSLSYPMPAMPKSVCKQCKRNAAGTGSPFSMTEG